MPSGKQSKRRRQAVRQAPPPSSRSRQASPRVLLAVAGVVVLVVVGVVLGIVLSGGSSGSSNAPAGTLAEASAVRSLFSGIPQHGRVLGSPSAPATMVEYVDLQCPFCREFETQAMPTLIAKYVRKGKVKVEARPIAFLGPDSVTGRRAALAAAEQNKFFDFAQLLYDNQGTENTGWLNDSIIKSAATSIPGLDVAKLLSERSSAAVTSQADALDAQAQAGKVNSTPTILVGKTGSTPKQVQLAAPSDAAAVSAAIDAALR